MDKYISKSYSFLFGIILFLVGLSLIFDQMIVFNIIWEALIIAWGVLNLRQKDFFYALALISFGVIFMIDTIFNLGITNILIGLFISSIGIKELLKDIK